MANILHSTSLFLTMISLLFAVETKDIRGSVSCDEKKIIVDRHNELRKRVAEGNLPGQPKASNMMKMAWDDNLEVIAQKWANKALKEHNRNANDDRFRVGENLYFSWSTSPDTKSDWISAVDNWFNEHELYEYSTDFNSETGHYTQVVWANTIYVGCGYSYYVENGATHKTYVCNYGPAGNFIGQYPYETGTGCEELCCKDQCVKLYGDEC